ncbi:DUF1418 family protein [Photorhabdus namnaonensis]|uniref:Uncharacterized protein n=2 Tax=Photorhabdus namnaonensis TaxID=1851568 RepID=A0A1B8YH03_9GAMM|nr:hypothetical protein Phpb_02862 [Photorhabdus namnaonensis]
MQRQVIKEGVMKSHQGSMSSLADMPKQVILLEIVGISGLLLAYLTINDIVVLTDLLMTPEAHVVMIFTGIYPMDFKVHRDGKRVNPREHSKLCDWGERV